MSTQPFAPVSKQSLSSLLVQHIANLWQSGHYGAGDRLPSIAEMARRFGVGAPSIREALKKLETVGAVEIRHGCGVFVTESGANELVMRNPLSSLPATKRLLLDLLDARVVLELRTAQLAAVYVRDDDLALMRQLLDEADAHLLDDEILTRANLGFHRQIARASGNQVLDQLLGVIVSLFREEQQLILRIFGSRDQDHREHRGILAALEARDSALAMSLMRGHLEGVRRSIQDWDPDERAA